MSVAVLAAGVTKTFRDGETEVRVLNGIDLVLPCGGMSFLVGPSGCGKTTLVSVMSGILRASSGGVEVFGTRLGSLKPVELARFRAGSAAALMAPDAIAVDVFGYNKLWPGAPLVLGRELELNDRRAVVAAISEALPGFSTNIIIHSRFSRAVTYVPTTRNQVSFVLAGLTPGEDPARVAARVATQTGLQALTAAEFRWKTIRFFLLNTGIPVNFSIVILLGVIVGGTVVGLTFSLFVADNIRQYASLKAMGMDDGMLTRLVLLQVAVVGSIGYAFGLAMSAAFFEAVGRGDGNFRNFILPGWVAMAAFGLVAVIVLAASLASLRRLRRVDPGIVFR